MISKQAQEFWALLKSYPKQIAMPLSQARVLVPNYRLAPEHPFPAAVDDAVHAYQWLLEHGDEPSKTIVAGDSAGGGIAISTAISLRDRHLPMCAGIVALSPWADLTCTGESMTSRVAVDIECTRAGLLEMAGQYLNGTRSFSTFGLARVRRSRRAPAATLVVG